MKTIRTVITVFASAVAFTLLFAVANATALTNTAPATAAGPATNVFPGKAALAPAAAVASPASSASEDIRDIRQPRHVPTPWLPRVIAVGVIILVASALVIWRWVCLAPVISLPPHVIALERLEEARRLMNPEHAREYCFAVSQIIRGYIEERSRLHAPRLTTEEFLRELTASPEALLAPHRTLLGDFLEHCDLAKFAGWYYCRPDLEAMHLTAVEFVRQSAANPPAAGRNCASAAPGESSMTPEQECRKETGRQSV